MNIKKMIFGEKVPDKDDPNYKEKHEKTMAVGKKFAQKLRLDKAAAAVQRFANANPKSFLAIVFSVLLISMTLNIWRLSAASVSRSKPSSAVERQESELKFNRHAPKPIHRDKGIDSRNNDKRQSHGQSEEH